MRARYLILCLLLTACASSAPQEALPPHLPREEHAFELDPGCPLCGNVM